MARNDGVDRTVARGRDLKTSATNTGGMCPAETGSQSCHFERSEKSVTLHLDNGLPRRSDAELVL